MKSLKRMLCLLLCAAMLPALLAGCGQKTDAEEKFVLRASVCGQIDSLDPAMNTDESAGTVFYTLFENLMRFTNDGTGAAVVTNGIAREYTVTGNYDGSVTYQFTLRSSARWSDGEKVTADDFVYAWRRLVDPATGSPNHEVLNMVAGYDAVRQGGELSALGVSAKNESTFCVTLSAPCASFLDGVCTSVATMPLRQDIVEKDPENWAGTFNIVTDGAYRVGTWTKESFLQTKRNEDYYESRLVGPDAIRFIFADDTAGAYRLYEAGEIDYVSDLPQEVITKLTDEGSWTVTPLLETYCVFYNHVTEAFSNREVRQAFDLSIDRASIAQSIGTKASPASGLVPSGVRDSEDGTDYRAVGGELCAIDAEGFAARCEEAQKQLASAGYPNGRGFPDAVFLYSTDDDISRLIAAALQNAWRDTLGAAVRLNGVSQAEYDQRLAAGDYDLAITCLSAQQNDAMSFLGCFESQQEKNTIRYVNNTYDMLMGVVEKSDNTVARTAFLHDAEELLLGDASLSPVVFGAAAHLLREGLQGVYSDGLGNSFLTSVTQITG